MFFCFPPQNLVVLCAYIQGKQEMVICGKFPTTFDKVLGGYLQQGMSPGMCVIMSVCLCALRNRCAVLGGYLAESFHTQRASSLGFESHFQERMCTQSQTIAYTAQ